jgi:hypothetical protein
MCINIEETEIERERERERKSENRERKRGRERVISSQGFSVDDCPDRNRPKGASDVRCVSVRVRVYAVYKVLVGAVRLSLGFGG